MIREDDVREAIAEMQGQRNPNSSTCIKLAAYYTILDHITERPEEKPVPDYDSASYFGEDPDAIAYSGDSDFAKAVNGKRTEDVLAVVDELMATLQVMYPRLYNSVMQRL